MWIPFSLEHRRRFRNTSTQPGASTSSLSHGPSLPDDGSLRDVSTIDTWNNVPREQAPHPQPNTLAQTLHGQAPPQQTRAPISGPPPPRSWVTRSIDQLDPSIHERSVASSGKKPFRRRRMALSKDEEEKRRERLLEIHFGDEYWHRRAGSSLWNSWRERAIGLSMSYTHIGEEISASTACSKHPFVPFKSMEDTSSVPTLFELTLSLLFDSIVPIGEGVEAGYEEAGYEDEINDLLYYLPNHIQRSVLRYAATHYPFSGTQLLKIYHAPESAPVHDSISTSTLPPYDEIVISGRNASSGLVARLKDEPPSEVEISTTNKGDQPTEVSPRTIILFQIADLNKRHLASFPKSLTTLALVALPPPTTYEQSRTSAVPTKTSFSKGTGLTQTVFGDNSDDEPPARPSTPLSVLSSLASLPTLLPCLVTLDVSYNPWLSSEKAIKNTKIISRSTHATGFGILGRWDLRLWGRLRVLGVRSCFEASDSQSNILPDLSTASLPFEALLNRMRDRTANMGASLTSDTHAFPSEIPSLVETWERDLYSIGREVKFVWKEGEWRFS